MNLGMPKEANNFKKFFSLSAIKPGFKTSALHQFVNATIVECIIILYTIKTMARCLNDSSVEG